MDQQIAAHHEAGHIIGGLLRGCSFELSSIAPNDIAHGFVKFRPTGAYRFPATRAFLMWCGPYAESRFSGRPLRDVIAADNCAADREHFARFRSPANDRAWAKEIDQHWSTVEQAAEMLLVSPTLAPDQPNPLQDPREFLAALA